MSIINEIITNIDVNKINNLPEKLKKIALVKMPKEDDEHI